MIKIKTSLLMLISVYKKIEILNEYYIVHMLMIIKYCIQ